MPWGSHREPLAEVGVPSPISSKPTGLKNRAPVRAAATDSDPARLHTPHGERACRSHTSKVQNGKTNASASGCSRRKARSSAARRLMRRNRGMAMPNSRSNKSETPVVSPSPQAQMARSSP